jgi:hypothetical protein
MAKINFTSNLTPEYESDVFVIDNFTAGVNNSQCLYSDSMFASGVEWRLKIYVGGSAASSVEYLSVFVEVVSGLQETSPYQYRVELVLIFNSAQR